MRGLSTLYRLACEEEGCLCNSQLVELFASLDKYSPCDESSDDFHEQATAEKVAAEKAVESTSAVNQPVHSNHFLAQRACPAVLDFTNNYLGDAGLAAVFRVLPLMRWVTHINARGCGAGNQAMKVLADMLVLEFPSQVDYGQGKRIGVPLLSLRCIDLRDNALFAAAGRMLCSALKARRSIIKRNRDIRHGIPSITDDLLPLEVLVDYSNFPSTMAKTIRDFNTQASKEAKNADLERQRREEAEIVRLFTCRGGGEAETENVIYRLPHYYPGQISSSGQGSTKRTSLNEGDVRSTSPNSLSSRSGFPFYDASNPHVARLVREINIHMEDYLVAFKCLSKRSIVDAKAGIAEFEQGLAAAQVCVDLGAETLSWLPLSSASIWYQFMIHSPPSSDSKVQIDELENDVGPKSNPNLPSTIDFFPCDAEKLEKPSMRYAEIQANVSALLRGFYANPFLEEEIIKNREPTLVLYIHELKSLLYEAVLPPQNSDLLENHMLKLESLYYRVVAALVTKRMDDLPSMAPLEQRLQDIRSYMIHEMLERLEANDLYTFQKALRQEAEIPATSSSSLSPSKFCLKPASALRPPFTGPSPVSLSTEDSFSSHNFVSSPYRSVLPLWCSEMKYFLFNHPQHWCQWNAEYLADVQEALSKQQHERQERLLSTMPYTSYPYQRSLSLPISPQRRKEQEKEDLCNGRQASPYVLLSRSSSSSSSVSNKLTTTCRSSHRKTSVKPLRAPSHSPKPKGVDASMLTGRGAHEQCNDKASRHRSLFACSCSERLKDTFPSYAFSPLSAASSEAAKHGPGGRPTQLPRPCPSCCFASLTVLRNFLQDPVVQERMALQEKVRDALPMELKVFFFDMLLRRRSRCAYIPRVFGIGTRLPPSDHPAISQSTLSVPSTQCPSEMNWRCSQPEVEQRSSTPNVTERRSWMNGENTILSDMFVSPHHLVSVVDFFAAVDGKKELLSEVLSAFEEWYRLKMVESFDVSYPYLERPRFSRTTLESCQPPETHVA